MYSPAPGEPFIGNRPASSKVGNAFPTSTNMSIVQRQQRRNNIIYNAHAQVEQFEPDWTDHNQIKYFVVYSYTAKRWLIRSWTSIQSSNCHVSSEENAKAVAEILTSYMPNGDPE